MITIQASFECAASAASAFQHVGHDFFDNHSKWDPMLVGMEMRSPGPVGVGTRGRERRAIGPFRPANDVIVTTFDPDREFGFEATSGPVREQFSCRITPTAHGSAIAVDLRFRISPVLRPFQPLIDRAMRRNVTRNLVSMRKAIDNDAATTTTGVLLGLTPSRSADTVRDFPTSRRRRRMAR